MVWKRIGITTEEMAALDRIFGEKARFLFDEDVDPAVRDYLRHKGFNSKTAEELGLRGHPDENVLAAARKEGRILLTHNEDYLDERKHPPQGNPGVVILPQGYPQFDRLVRAMRIVVEVIAPYRGLWERSTVKIGAGGEVTVNGYEADGARRERRYKVDEAGQPWIWEDES